MAGDRADGSQGMLFVYFRMKYRDVDIFFDALRSVCVAVKRDDGVTAIIAKMVHDRSDTDRDTARAEGRKNMHQVFWGRHETAPQNQWRTKRGECPILRGAAPMTE